MSRSSPILLVAPLEESRHLARRILARCGRVSAVDRAPDEPVVADLTVVCAASSDQILPFLHTRPLIILVEPGVSVPDDMASEAVIIPTPYAPEALIVAAEHLLPAHEQLPETLLGRSPAMERLRERLERVAGTRIPVLLTGETGTGKELAARQIHRLGSSGTFVAVNCGAIPQDLLEAELFGVARGAYSGATHTRAGLFEVADGGTLFLDEVGDLPLALQVKLNRAVAEGEYRRVGDAQARHASPRLVAATHRDIAAMTVDGTFREDLYYRLAVVKLTMPPLRERAGDIHTLAQAFLTDAATRAGKPVPRLSTGALNALSAYAWPGNVRELRNTIERAVVFVDGGVITPDDLELDLSPALPDLAVARDAASESAGSYREACQFAERAAGRTYLSALLRRHHGSVSACARHEGVERETMHRWLKRHGLDASGFRGERETVTDQPTP